MKLPPALLNITRKQWLIGIAVATVLVAGLLLWLLMGALNKLGADDKVPGFLRRAGDGSSLFAQIEQKQAAIAKQRDIAKRLPVVTAELEGMKTEIEAARKRLPREAQKAEMRQLIEDLARQVGGGSKTIVKSVQIRESAPPKATRGRGPTNDIATIEYSTQVVTDMDGLIQFVNLIERNERFMTIDGIQLASGGVETDKTTGKVELKPHNVTLRILTYIDRGTVGAGN